MPRAGLREPRFPGWEDFFGMIRLRWRARLHHRGRKNCVHPRLAGHSPRPRVAKGMDEMSLLVLEPVYAGQRVGEGVAGDLPEPDAGEHKADGKGRKRG